MAGSWRSDRCRPGTASCALVLGALLATDALGVAEPLRVEHPVRRLGVRAGYLKLGGVTKPVLAPNAAGRVEIGLDDVPAGRLHVASGILPGKRRLSGRYRCEVSLSGRVRRSLATVEVVGGRDAWVATSVPLDGTRGARMVLECPKAGAARRRIAWAQPLLVPEEPVPAQPLIVVVSLDTLRADHVSGFGAPAGTTPALARLGSEGIRFVHTTAEATWTLPSHFSLFYGRLYGFLPSNLPAQGLAQLLAEHGYVTVALTGGGFMGSLFRFHVGFDDFAEYDAHLQGTSDVRMLPAVLADVRAAIARFDGAPLFLFVHTYAVHELTPKERAWASRRNGDLAQAPPSPALIRWARDFYGGLVRKTDRVLAPFLMELRRAARERPVLLVVMSDHGEAFGEHHNFRHGDDGPRVTLHEEVVRVPLVVWGPSMVARGVVSSRPTMLSDIAPSILAAAGIPKGATMTGENLWPLMSVDASGDGPVPSWRASISRGTLGWVLRSTSHKLTFELCAVGPCRLELYALDRDPEERRNLAKSHPRAVAALIGRLSRRVASLTGVLGMEGMPPMCPLCGYDQTAAFWDQVLSEARVDERPGVDAATRERLRALGYADR